MSDLRALVACLKSIEDSARAFVLVPANPKTREELSNAVAVAAPILEETYDIGGLERERSVIARELGPFRNAISAMEADQSPDQHRLILSYVRGTRSRIARLLPQLEAQLRSRRQI